jgi:glucosamine--fructose-6-phosphate aminotransferase (isomerizing)
LIKRFTKIGADFFRSVVLWRFFVGINPRNAPSGSIILFPCYPDRLHCGLAGIMAVKRPSQSNLMDAIEMLTRCYHQIKDKGMQSLLSQQIKISDYLNGNQCLQTMERSLELLKLNECFDALFFNTEQTGHIWTILKRMTAFFAEQEQKLEENADQFSTSDLEAINSRLVRLKDIIWALEKDILDNQERIIKLAGARSPADLTPVSLKKYRDINFLLNCIDRLEVRGRDSAGIQILFSARSSQDRKSTRLNPVTIEY